MRPVLPVILLTAKIRQRKFATLTSTAVAALLLAGLIWYVAHFDILP